MNPDRQQAIDYLRAPARGLWRWAEGGTVLVWQDGSTIAFREEIEQILEWLAPNGLPSFGAIVLLLAACRGKIPAVADIVLDSNAPLPAGMGKDAAVLLVARKQLKAQLESALAQLGKVSQLPGELNSGLKSRCILAEAVFEPARAERYAEARTVLRGLRDPISDADLLAPEPAGVSGGSIRQIHLVAEGLKPHTAESLTLRLRTGLDALPRELDANLPAAERARSLIEELGRDRECGAVARAARELMAAVRLPRRLGESDPMAIGGVADITNRGPLDRLLLSELAHDDHTLSVRVALNEALYLRREPPRREPSGALSLLLDSGVRLWGVPRVLATAVALALVARDRQHNEITAWRSHRNALQPVDLLSRRGLVEHLGALETEAHPGESMSAFAKALSSGGENQSVLITHRDTLADPEFRRALAANPDTPGFVAVVDREGRFELHALPLAHRPPVCAADLDLPSIFDDRTGVTPLRNDLMVNLPAIFGLLPFPFLLPVRGKLDCWTKNEAGFIHAVVNERRLIQFRDQSAGARGLTSDLPYGKTIWMECVEGTLYVVKAGASQRPARLLSLSLPDGGLRVTDLSTEESVLAVYRYGDAILVIRRTVIRAYALSDGRHLGHAMNPHIWMNGRFFRGPGHHYFVVWDGENVKFEPVTLPGGIPFGMVAQILDRQGMEGPWLLTRSGEIIATVNGQETRLNYSANSVLNFNATRVSDSGHRLFAPVDGSPKPGAPVGCLFCLSQGSYRMLYRQGHELDDAPAMPFWNMFRIVESVARTRDGIAFCGRKNRWRKLILGPRDTLTIFELPANERDELLSKVSFTAQAKPTKRGCTLQAAEWPCGSQAFLDSRGLLHLKSHDPNVPEISLVLSDGEVAGWTSDGLRCGPKFFFEDAQVSEPVRVFERLMQFLKLL